VIASGESASASVEAIPDHFGLDAPYPNPFNAVTTFTLNLSEAGQTTLRVYNLLGQQVSEIFSRNLPAGVHHINWEAKDNNGLSLPSGVYMARLETPGRSAIRKIILLR
jgi:flagellar hook assembly protein FlgD